MSVLVYISWAQSWDEQQLMRFSAAMLFLCTVDLPACLASCVHINMSRVCVRMCIWADACVHMCLCLYA